MKKYIVFLSAALIALAFSFASCDKDNDPGNQKSKTELLAQGSWKFKAAATATGTDISNQVPPFDPCKKDNIITFSINGTGNISEGAVKCNAADPDNIPFTWNFLTNETVLHVSAEFFDLDGDFTLQSINDTRLVVAGLFTPTVGPSFQVIITFEH